MLIAMNGVKYPPESPKNCVFCGNLLLHPSGSHYVAYRTASGSPVTSFVPMPRTRKTGKPVGGRHEAGLRGVRHNQVWFGAPEALLPRILLQTLQGKIPCASGAGARAHQELAPMAVRLRIDRDHNFRQFNRRTSLPLPVFSGPAGRRNSLDGLVPCGVPVQDRIRAPRQYDEVETATERGLPQARCARAARALRSHLPRSVKGVVRDPGKYGRCRRRPPTSCTPPDPRGGAPVLVEFAQHDPGQHMGDRTITR